MKGMISTKMAAVILTVSLSASSIFGFCGGYIAGGAGKSGVKAQETAFLSADLSEASDLAVFDGIVEGKSQERSFVTYTDMMAESTGGQTELTIPQIAAAAADSVVEITTESVSTDRMMRQYITEGAGSGVIISSDGYIVTNNHVIAGASKITVRLRDGSTYSASLKGTDSTTDLAVVKIEASGLKAASLGSSGNLQVGETAVAIGNPLGQLGGTVTDGIISALDRSIVIDGKTMNLMQTNAAINPGNSGGGLFDNKGKLIGIVVAKSSGSDVEGLGFAIPIDDAKSVINSLLTSGYVSGRIDLGMTMVDISTVKTAFLYGLTQTGVYVQKVDADSNAARAGIRSSDRIAAVGNTAVSTAAELTKALEAYSVGDTVTMTIVRGNIKYNVSFVLEEYRPS